MLSYQREKSLIKMLFFTQSKIPNFSAGYRFGDYWYNWRYDSSRLLMWKLNYLRVNSNKSVKNGYCMETNH